MGRGHGGLHPHRSRSKLCSGKTSLVVGAGADVDPDGVVTDTVDDGADRRLRFSAPASRLNFLPDAATPNAAEVLRSASSAGCSNYTLLVCRSPLRRVCVARRP